MANEASIAFRCTLGDGDRAGHLRIEGDVRATFGRARPPVIVVVNGYAYRSTVSVMNGKVFVPFRASHREAAGVAPGEEVDVTLTLDTAPRTVEVPDDLSAALDAAAALAGWERMSFTDRRERVEGIEQAKRPETRARRVAAAVAAAGAKAGSR